MALLALLLPLLSVVLSASATVSVCSKFPYEVLLPLSKYPAAESFCSSKYPLLPCTSSVTTTLSLTRPPVTATSTVATVTLTTATSTVTTTVSTSTETDITATITNTVTTGTQTNTVTTGTVTNIVFTTTVTVTATTDAAPMTIVKRTAGPLYTFDVPARSAAASKNLGRRKHTTMTTMIRPTTTTDPDPHAALFSSLQHQAALFVSTLCSCIETQPPCTITTATATTTVGGGTSTLSVIATSPVQATTTTSVTAMTTISTDTTTITSVQATITTSVVGTTTISTATTTTLFVFLPTPACQPGTQRAGGVYNCEFTVFCGQQVVTASPEEIPTAQAGVTSEAQCLLNCSNDPLCNLFNFDAIANVCTLYDASGAIGGSVTAGPNAYADYGKFTGNC